MLPTTTSALVDASPSPRDSCEINTKIGALLPTEELLTSIAEEAARLLQVDNTGLRLVEGDELVLAGLAGERAHITLMVMATRQD